MVLAAVRHNWADAILAVTAIVLLVLSALLASTVLAGAGSALAGAAAARIVDSARESRAKAKQAEASRRADLDETRRVAYMALLALRSRDRELVATIVNALAHHGLAVDPQVAATHVLNLVSDMPVNRGESERWLQERIDQITAELSP
jgi:hypothetical protein